MACLTHRWPRGNPGKLIRSIGEVEYSFCSNCLAVKITFTTSALIDGVWTTFSDEQIVQPGFQAEYLSD